jgi:hypothetical protein
MTTKPERVGIHGDRGSHLLICFVQHEEKGALILQIGRKTPMATKLPHVAPGDNGQRKRELTALLDRRVDLAVKPALKPLIRCDQWRLPKKSRFRD